MHYPSKQWVCTCTEQGRWYREEVRGWPSDFLVLILQQPKQTPPQRHCGGQTWQTHKIRIFFFKKNLKDTKSTFSVDTTVLLLTEKWGASGNWDSPSGRWGLLSTLPTLLTNTFAAVSFTSTGRSSPQHEHTSAPHWSKQAAALAPWVTDDQKNTWKSLTDANLIISYFSYTEWVEWNLCLFCFSTNWMNAFRFFLSVTPVYVYGSIKRNRWLPGVFVWSHVTTAWWRNIL